MQFNLQTEVQYVVRVPGYPGTRPTRVRVPEKTGTRQRVRVVPTDKIMLPVWSGCPAGYNSTGQAPKTLAWN